jgi:hypothetical protein
MTNKKQETIEVISVVNKKTNEVTVIDRKIVAPIQTVNKETKEVTTTYETQKMPTQTSISKIRYE